MSSLDNLSLEELKEKMNYYRKTWGIGIMEEDEDETEKK